MCAAVPNIQGSSTRPNLDDFPELYALCPKGQHGVHVHFTQVVNQLVANPLRYSGFFHCVNNTHIIYVPMRLQHILKRDKSWLGLRFQDLGYKNSRLTEEDKVLIGTDDPRRWTALEYQQKNTSDLREGDANHNQEPPEGIVSDSNSDSWTN
jgi:hypothetical protein